MKIVILNPYLDSLGGGEKVTTVMADYLSQMHEVTILVKAPIDRQKIEKYFDVDLTRVKFAVLPAAPWLVRILAHPRGPMPGRLRSLLYDRASLRSLQKNQADLFFNNLYQSNLRSPFPKSVYMCMFPQKITLAAPRSNLVRQKYNQLADYLEKRSLGTRQEAINSYTMVTANSKYTAGWIKKYWGRDAVVVYPVCDNMGPPAPKKNVILHVGRFFADNGSSHHKKQHELIKAFIKLNRADWELHLVGSAAKDSESQKFIDYLHQLSQGHSNIFIHTNEPLANLKTLYQQATIYWHATGLGYDPNLYPENQEHFGISTVEAMSAGAIPIVIRSAGQLEIVQHHKNGLLWDTIDELIHLTNQVIDNPTLQQSLASAALATSSLYGRAAFLKRIDQIMESLNQ